MNFHKLLERQLKKFLPASMLDMEEVKSFINAVNNSYQSFERDNQLNAHAFSINEIEYAKINEALKQEVDLRRLSIRELKEAIVNMKEEGDDLEINTDEDNLLDTLQFLKNEITRRIETEQHLKNSQDRLYTSAKRLSQLISNLHNGILLEDEYRKIIVTNQLFCNIFNIPVLPSDLVGADCTQSAEQSKHLFKNPDQFVKDLEQLIEDKKLVTGEIIELADGRVFMRDYIPIFIDEVYKGHLWKYDDITQQQENERQLKRLSLVASANEEGILFTDTTGKIVWINEGYKVLTGYEINEMIGKTLIEITKGPLSDKAQLHKMVDAYFLGDKFDIETRHYRKDGSWFFSRAKGQPILDEQGKVINYFTRVEDITLQKNQDQQLRLLSTIAQENINAVVTTDAEGKITWVNKSFTQITGYELDEIRGFKPGHILQGKETNVNTVAYLRQQIKEAKDFYCEILNYNKSGEKYWLRLRGQPMFSDEGQLTGYFAIEEDITNEKFREAEIQRLSLVASANTAGVCLFDENETFLWVNAAYEKITGFTADELIGKIPRNLFSGTLTESAVLYKMLDNAEQNKSFKEEFIQYRKDGSHYWARLNMQYVTDTAGVNHRFGILEDITEEKAKELNIQRLSLVASANNKGVAIVDGEESYAWVNPTFTNLSGYNESDLIGYEHVNLFMGPLTDTIVKERIITNLIKQMGFTEEFLFYRKDQSTFWARLNRQFVFDASGKVIQKFSILEDISQQKETEQKLKDSEQMFRSTLQKIGDNVWEHDFTTGETIFSKEENDLLGYSTSDYKQNDKLWWNSVYPPDIPLLKANDKLTRKGEIDYHTLEYRLKNKDGSIKWVLDRGVVIAKDEAGKPLKMIGTHTDITRIKQTELELEQRVKQFSSLSENVPGVIVEYEYRKDGTEGYRYISPAIEKIIGITQEDFLHHYSYIHPDDQKQNTHKNRHSRDTLEPFYNESRLIVPGKGTIWCSVTASFSYWSETGSKVFTGFILNITQKKMAEEILKQEEDKYRSIITNMNLGLLEVNLDQKIIFANQSFCKMSGYKIDELIGKVATQLFLRSDNNELLEQKNELRKKGASDAYEIVIKNKQGDMKWWLISGAPRYDDDGTLIGSIGIHLDITEQKKLELELIDAREQAEASSKSKEAFLANMSHEIRTPMNAIMGMSNQLSKTTLNDQQRFFLENISSASENLLIIINDILDLSKIEAGKLSLENIGFEPKMVISRVMQVLTHRAEEKGLLISNNSCDCKLSPVLIGDPYRLNQVLLNLMSNSIKFTEKGYVDLSCAVIEDAPRYQTVAITVKDTGIGMDEEYVKNIFEKFTQEDTSVTRKYGGTGLGMSISKDLVQLMGGTIQVESKKGVGTSITFQIKFIKGTGADLPSKDSYTLDSSVLKGKRILVVDDNDLNRLVACTLLKHYAIETYEATNGKEAIEMLQMESIDLVLMDIQMPIMDGIEATRIIRKSISGTLPLVALTANALKGDNEKYLEAGMNDYLSKPFKEEALLRIVSIWLGKEKAIIAQPKFGQAEDENMLYDLSKLKEISKGNAAFVNKMIALFLEQIPSTVAEIKEGFVQEDFDRIYALAHRIKPTIDNLNIHSLKTEIRSIEAFAKNKVGGQQLQSLIDKLERVILEVKDIIVKEIE